MIGRAYGIARSAIRNQRGRRDLPRMLTYIVTFGCNARCVMCDSWKKPSPGDLSPEELDGILAQFPRMDFVRITGGEPSIRKDLPELAEIIRRRLDPLILHVTTNAFLTDQVVEFCESRVKDRPLHMLVSVDGFEAKHDEVRGREESWSRAMATIEALAPRRKELKLSLAVNQTIVDEEGLEHYALLREHFRPLGIHNQFVMGYEASATYSLEKEVDLAPVGGGEFTTFGNFDRGQLERVLDEVEADLKHYDYSERVAKRYYMRGIRNRLLGKGGKPSPKCVALNSHMRLYPDGTVPTCQFNSQRVGNLRDMSFDELWHGEEAEKQWRWVKACAGCWAECEVLPNALYSGALVKEAVKF